MKKIILSTILFFAGLGFLHAQKSPEKVTAKTSVATAKMHNKTTKVSEETEVRIKSTGLKKDGTPDMRLKENKIAANQPALAGPTKKNGTADLRYKANRKK